VSGAAQAVYWTCMPTPLRCGQALRSEEPVKAVQRGPDVFALALALVPHPNIETEGTPRSGSVIGAVKVSGLRPGCPASRRRRACVRRTPGSPESRHGRSLPRPPRGRLTLMLTPPCPPRGGADPFDFAQDRLRPRQTMRQARQVHPREEVRSKRGYAARAAVLQSGALSAHYQPSRSGSWSSAGNGSRYASGAVLRAIREGRGGRPWSVPPPSQCCEKQLQPSRRPGPTLRGAGPSRVQSGTFPPLLTT
jgi:hypothetical protein